MGDVRKMMGCIFKNGTLFLERTWVSFPGPIPDDFPDEFDLDDFNGEPDLEGMARAQRQKDVLTVWEPQQD